MDFLDAVENLSRSVAIPIQTQHPFAKQSKEPTFNPELSDRFVSTLREPRHERFKWLLIQPFVEFPQCIAEPLRLARRVFQVLLVFKQEIRNAAVFDHDAAAFVVVVAEEPNTRRDCGSARWINFSSRVKRGRQIVRVRTPLRSHHLAEIRERLMLFLTTQQEFCGTN